MAFSDGFVAGASVRNQRENRKALKQQRDEELARLGYSFKDGQMFVRPGSMAEGEQLQALEATQLAKSLQGKLAAQDTDNAFENFSLTGDASYLQGALDNNPELKKAWGERGVQLVSNIDFKNDANLLARTGFSGSTYDTAAKQDVIRKNAYKIYNGKEWSIGLAGNAFAETGAAQRLGARRSQPMFDNQRSFRDMMAGPASSPNTAEGHKYEAEIQAAASETGLPANLIASMIAQESSGNNNAVSPKGAMGLMQLMPDTAAELGVKDPHNPAENIMAGARYLNQMLDKYGGDLKVALAAYNAGPGNVDKYGGIPPFGETQNYVAKITGNLDKAEKYYNNTADNVMNTILEHRRGIANAAAGKTNAQVDQEAALAVRATDQKDRQLDLEQSGQEIKKQTDGRTSEMKNLDAAQASTTELLDLYQDEDTFFSTDFSDPKEYRRAYPYINRIEQLEGTELSEADKKAVTEMRQLIALSDPAKDLSNKDTGLIDSQIGTFEKYFNDDTDGAAAKSAYAAFRNTVRNALFGSALTEGEIKSFDEAYGKLGQKLGPVLEQFKTSLEQVQAKLDSTSNLMNPYSAKVRLGADQEKLTKIRDALQARIEYIEGLNTGTIKPGGAKGKQAVINAFEGKN